ncbi:hypothetical protein ACJ73_02290 [Blastomyces percursus]|uniref:FluG domain-containing protein n=1 Tax=Blastomyces percursus TaxID=1658174 RepID=A0A1J9R1Q9_9EURO|nr:hypothetical protein ACJ73_02290 [Blastomyces percursus]
MSSCLWKPSKPTKECRRARKKIVEELTPDEYRARDTVRLARFQVTGKKYADATISAINRVQCCWDRHCLFMGVDDHSHLSACVDENFRVYADWRLKNFNITKQNTIWVEWKFLRLLFKETGRKVDELVGELISEFILGPLTDDYDLDLSIDYKPVVSVEDLVAILHYHWCLDTASVTHERYAVQNPLLMLFIAYTSSRPGALIESGCLRGSNDTLCYKNIVLRVIPNPDQPDRHVLVMEVSLMFMKGKRNKSQPTTYIFHERDDNLALCPVSHFLALALADDAFDARGINSVEDVLRIRVMAPRNSLHLKWKPHMLNIPVFRRAVHAAEGFRISPDKALPYDTFNQYLRRLGRNAGFEHKLESYCIRRGTANTVDTVATTSERNQVMGHSRADIFERFYISVKVKRDVQSAYLGCPARESIIQVVGRFSLTRDPRAPKELSNEQKEAIERDPQLMKLCDRQRSLHKLIERKYGSVLKSKGTALHREYTELGDTIRAEKQTLHREAFEEMRQRFSINEELKTDDEDKIQFVFKERARLDQNLFRACQIVEPKTSTRFTFAECKQSRIGFHSAAYARGSASGESHLPTLELILRLMASLTRTPFPSHVQVPSVSSVSEIASCHTPREYTPFHGPTTFEDMSKVATSAILTLMLCSGVLTRHAQMCWMTLKISRGTRFWSTMYMFK